MEEFVYAFDLYRRLGNAPSEKRDALDLARAVRSFYLAFEKGFKQVIVAVDPYLLIVKPDHDLLLKLRRDMRARPVPSIFCSRQPFESPNLIGSWKLAKELVQPQVDNALLADFERALGRLADVRHRAQHAEFYDDIDDVLALLGQLMARVRPVLGAVSEEMLKALYARNNQLESLLTGIENRIDAAWQVLTDYLRKYGPITVRTSATILLGAEDQTMSLGTGQAEPVAPLESRILVAAQLPLTSATGFFREFLTPDRVGSRELAREVARPSQTDFTTNLGFFQYAKVPGPRPRPKGEPVIPLERGTLKITAAAGWLSLWLSNLHPPFLGLSVILDGWRIDFPDPQDVLGSIAGTLRSPVQLGEAEPAPVTVGGKAHLVEEWALGPDASRESYPGGVTYRELDLEIHLSVEDAAKLPP